VRTDRLFATRCVQRPPSANTPLQSWLVEACGNRDHLTPGACCFAREDGPKRGPAYVVDARGEGVVADLHVFERDRVVLAQQGKRRLVLEVAPLPLHLLVRALEQRYGRAAALTALLAAGDALVRLGEVRACPPSGSSEG
jgi:hypothetical protein